MQVPYIYILAKGDVEILEAASSANTAYTA